MRCCRSLRNALQIREVINEYRTCGTTHGEHRGDHCWKWTAETTIDNEEERCSSVTNYAFRNLSGYHIKVRWINAMETSEWFRPRLKRDKLAAITTSRGKESQRQTRGKAKRMNDTILFATFLFFRIECCLEWCANVVEEKMLLYRTAETSKTLENRSSSSWFPCRTSIADTFYVFLSSFQTSLLSVFDFHQFSYRWLILRIAFFDCLSLFW